MIFKLGQRTVLAASSTQVKTASRLLGVAALLVDMGYKYDLKLWTDSSAARGVLARRGTGKIRHLATQALWVQKAVHDGLFSVGKVLGVVNPADVGTKFLDRPAIARIIDRMSLRVDTTKDDQALVARV